LSTEAIKLLATATAFVAALIAVLITTPFVGRLATSVGALDDPKRDERRIHTHPIPRLGGLALFFGILLGIAVGWAMLCTTQETFERLNAEIGLPWVGILCGAICILIAGALDDIFGMRPIVKLLAQATSAAVAIAFGVRIAFFKLPFMEGYTYLSMAQSVALTMLWIVGMVNALNLIDGLDGLAAGVSSIAAITLCILTLQHSMLSVACSLASIAGSCIGFLPYNFNPARIFMGDTGAMLLGYLFATFSIAGTVKSALAIWLLPVTAIVLGYPIADTVFAMLRRAAKLQPIFKADKSHLHHRLLQHGLSHRQAVLTLYMVSIALCVLAYAISRAM